MDASSGQYWAPGPNLNQNSSITLHDSSSGVIGNNDVLSSEIKMIRLRISDYYRDPTLEPLLYKFWKLMVEVQYERVLLKAVSHLGHIPLAVEVYERIIPVYERALGVYYQSSYYVAKRPDYRSETVFFDRFCYDFVSLLGVNLLFMDVKHLEGITRRVFTTVSYNFDFEVQKGVKANKGESGLRLVALECVRTAFTLDDMLDTNKACDTRNLHNHSPSATTLPGVKSSS